MAIKFTDKAVASLKPKGARYEVWDSSRKAFGLRVGTSGKKTWIWLYRFEGRARRLTLGSYPHMSLADAGLALSKAQLLHSKKVDPGESETEQRRRDRATPTVRELGEEYLLDLQRRGRRTWKEYERILNHDVLPGWGARRVNTITRADVRTLLANIAARAKILANRTFTLLRAMFRFAESQDYIAASPCHGLRTPSEERSRDRVLEPTEIAALWHGIQGPGISATVRAAVQFLLLTAQRIGEVTSAEWTEIDMDSGVWTLPAEKTKNKKPHRVPLSAQALAIVRQMRIASNSRWLFPSPQGDKPITSQAIDRALRRLRLEGRVPTFRPHDLRRTAATHMARLGVERLTIHKLLNHSDRSVTAIYDRYDREGEKREALKRWGDEVLRTVSRAGTASERVA